MCILSGYHLTTHTRKSPSRSLYKVNNRRLATTIKQQAGVHMGYLIAELFDVIVSVNAAHRAGSKNIVRRDIWLANW
ncbi:hypothetical protein M231_06188 [Tremella mesenterica]|uniref:Uncharacterized protein n=1 Tax=Tremella mesenterica TaxID=5217 RepID=A0A4Q1BCH0_TREME|nr:hypothetical protein M231_06188 [Tremella mesenterica]